MEKNMKKNVCVCIYTYIYVCVCVCVSITLPYSRNKQQCKSIILQ